MFMLMLTRHSIGMSSKPTYLHRLITHGSGQRLKHELERDTHELSNVAECNGYGEIARQRTTVARQ